MKMSAWLGSRETLAYGVSALVHVGILAMLAGRSRPILEIPTSPGLDEVVTLDSAWAEPQPIQLLEELQPAEAGIVVTPERAVIDQREFVQAPSFVDPVLDSEAAKSPPVQAEPPREATKPPPHEPAHPSASTPPKTKTQPTPPKSTKPTPPRKTAETSPQRPRDVSPQASPASTSQTAGTGVTRLPRPQRNPPPIYPSLAATRRWEGKTTLRVRIEADGGVSKVEVARSSGYPVLDAAAVRAIRNWVFTPALKDGKPTAITVRLPVRFSLD